MSGSRPVRVGNCSGFLGDRLAAMREMLEGGPLDVLTGDYLAELTMLILGRQRMKDASAGYARTFLRQLEDCLGLALERGVRIVSNAGGLNPVGLGDAVRALGTGARVAVVAGDDLLERWDELVGGERPLTANAYLGARGIRDALAGGADVVVTGRVTDASVVVGPAAWWHGWQLDGASDLDALAGATVAGHVLECGAQATGGNFSFFREIPGLEHVGFPLAEVASDGSCVVTKHPGTGGAVTVETVTEQLLYECTGARYAGPDVVARFDALRLEADGDDRVRIRGAVGEPPSGRLKVSTNRLGGFRNTMTVPLVGLDVEAKADLLRRQLTPALSRVAESVVVLARTDTADAGSEEEAAALLHVTVKDPDPKRVGRAFTASLVEIALASVPGFFPTTPPGDATPYGVYADAWVSAADVPGRLDGEPLPPASPPASTTAVSEVPPQPVPDPPQGPTRRVPLGLVAGARSGDKGGTCTLGVYARSDAGFGWLASHLTEERLLELLPEAREAIREVLPGLRAVLFQLPGLLGEGVAAGTRFDPQGKAVGEWLRSRVVDVPEALIEEVALIGEVAP